jgi:PDDEXK-like domain of unknown function (DUF3799)
MIIVSNAELSSDDYHKNTTHVSSSVLKLFLTDPRAYYDSFVLGNKPEQKKTDALIQGCHLHTAILEPEKLDVEYAVFSGSIRRGAEWEKFLINNDKPTIITQAQNKLTEKLVKNFRESEIILGEPGKETLVKLSSFYSNGVAEESIFGELDGMGIKVRFDYRRHVSERGEIHDLKTYKDPIGSTKDMRAYAESMHYDLSAALYIDMATKAFKVPYDFYLCFLSKADHKIKMFKCSENFIEQGREKYKKAIHDILLARKTGHYFIATMEEL